MRKVERKIIINGKRTKKKSYLDLLSKQAHIQCGANIGATTEMNVECIMCICLLIPIRLFYDNVVTANLFSWLENLMVMFMELIEMCAPFESKTTILFVNDQCFEWKKVENLDGGSSVLSSARLKSVER